MACSIVGEDVAMAILAATTLEHRLLPAGAILMLAVVAAVASRRLRLPLLITFLCLGMLLGSEGLGGIYFDDAQLSRTIGIFALIAILFEGGLTTEWGQIRPVLLPAFLLSTVGVFVTAAVTAVAAYWFFDLSRVGALLLGAVVGSTDAAAVFATLRFTALRPRLAALLNAESGANDPHGGRPDDRADHVVVDTGLRRARRPPARHAAADDRPRRRRRARLGR